MGKRDNTSTVEVIIIYLFIGLVLVCQFSADFNAQEKWLFVGLIAVYFWTAGLLLFAKVSMGLYLFEPLAFIGLIYELIFVVKPLVDLKNSNLIEHGVNVLSGGSKATLLLAFGYTVMFFAYYVETKGKEQTRRPVGAESYENPKTEEEKYSASGWYIAWGCVYVLCIVALLSQGMSLKYIFSLGGTGNREIDSSNVALLFLSNFGITLASIWLIIITKTKNVPGKIVVTVLSAVYLLMRNARWLVLVFIMAPIVYYYTKKQKSPRLIFALLVGVSALFLFAWMQANRTALNTGGAYRHWSDIGFTIGALLAPLESDLNTYRTFYSMVERFPDLHDYLYGTTFIYVLVLFVPRVIWPGKPDNPVRKMIEYSLNKIARASGTAVANIGEFYANFGTLGVVGGMLIFGRLAKMMKQKMLFSNSDKRIMIYSILWPLLYQWIARGNFSGNFYMTIFAIAPFLLIRESTVEANKSGGGTI